MKSQRFALIIFCKLALSAEKKMTTAIPSVTMSIRTGLMTIRYDSCNLSYCTVIQPLPDLKYDFLMQIAVFLV